MQTCAILEIGVNVGAATQEEAPMRIVLVLSFLFASSALAREPLIHQTTSVPTVVCAAKVATTNSKEVLVFPGCGGRLQPLTGKQSVDKSKQ